MGAEPAASPGHWVITLPAGMPLLNANHRGHWTRRHRHGTALRDATVLLARQQKIPHLTRALITGIYEPPDKRRRDPANLYPSFKACVDGLVLAGVLPDDDAGHLDGPDMRLGTLHPRGRLVLHIYQHGGL